jgi:hypothetical protein
MAGFRSSRQLRHVKVGLKSIDMLSAHGLGAVDSVSHRRELGAIAIRAMRWHRLASRRGQQLVDGILRVSRLALGPIAVRSVDHNTNHSRRRRLKLLDRVAQFRVRRPVSCHDN